MYRPKHKNKTHRNQTAEADRINPKHQITAFNYLTTHCFHTDHTIRDHTRKLFSHFGGSILARKTILSILPCIAAWQWLVAKTMLSSGRVT